MHITDHDDVVVIRVDEPADVGPARHAASRALARRACRVNLMTRDSEVDRRGFLTVTASILPNLSVRTNVGHRRHKTADGALDDAFAVVRKALVP